MYCLTLSTANLLSNFAFRIERSGMKNPLGALPIWNRLLHSFLLLTCSWRVHPSIRFCLSSCDVRSKGEAFPPRRCKLKKFNVVQTKTSIVSFYFIREMLRPYKSGRITREPDAVATPSCHCLNNPWLQPWFPAYY